MAKKCGLGSGRGEKWCVLGNELKAEVKFELFVAKFGLRSGAI